MRTVSTHDLLRRGALLTLIAVCVSLYAVSSALAAPVSLEDTSIWVQLWPEGEPGTNVVIIGARLPEGTPLPATVQLPIPEGATVYWAGEIVGRDATADIERDYTIVDTGNGKAAELTIETTLSVQVDVTYGTIEIDGNDLISRFQWTQSVPSSGTTFAVLVPRGTGDVDIEPAPPGEPRENEVGERLYTLSPAVLQPGSTYPITVTYRRAGVQDDTSGSTATVLWIIGALLAVAVVALVVAVGRQRRAS
ncbi:MAG: hypothetical protein CVT60_03625 [Actinobacteria bacterium HGW-Actinobacteria-10]|nr:MAG: hypothetical protein CVT60_03625 [Actinobacteria bacterium HGW-Actinobacteria-10]